MTNSTMPATVKDAAAAIRKDLKAAFPAATFSVRKGTGTASAWIDVAWSDGPTRDMAQSVCDPYKPHMMPGSPLEGVSLERSVSRPVLLAAQELIRAVLPDFEVFDADGRYVFDGPGFFGHAEVFHLDGWRFGGGSAYSALAEVADALILNPRTGPGA
jgi:hypothetical protein